jgi:hypothetical protein
MRAELKRVLRAAAAAASVSALAPVAHGQGKSIEKATRAERERRAAEESRRLASWELRLLEERKTQQQRRRDPSLAYAQIRDDYKQLQIVNNELARSVSAGGALDFSHVAKSVSEIRKRAERLRVNLALPEPQDTTEPRRPVVADEPQGLKSSLTLLDQLVMDFVDSPIFEQAKTVDVKTAGKARRNLEAIIEVSDRIRKGSEKLKKLAQKTP